MKLIHKAWLVVGPALVASLYLAGCVQRQEVVAEAHILAANQVCEKNGDVAKITRAYAQGEVENCGSHCVRATGRFLYSANVECNNGANFRLNFTE